MTRCSGGLICVAFTKAFRSPSILCWQASYYFLLSTHQFGRHPKVRQSDIKINILSRDGYGSHRTGLRMEMGGKGRYGVCNVPTLEQVTLMISSTTPCFQLIVSASFDIRMGGNWVSQIEEMNCMIEPTILARLPCMRDRTVMSFFPFMISIP